MCFTSTRRFEVFADQPSPHDSTRLLTTASEKPTSRAQKNIGLATSFGNISPFSKTGFAVEILTLQQNQLPQKSAGQKPTTCWQQKLSQVKGQLRPSFFQRNVPQAEFKQVSPGSNMDQQTTCTDILGNSNASQHNEVL